jgi:hypothetical protein
MPRHASDYDTMILRCGTNAHRAFLTERILLSTGTVWGPTHTPDGVPYGTLHETAVKQEFSLAYAHAVSAAARCTFEPVRVDVERVDFVIRQVANHLQHTNAMVDVQIKCTSQDVLKEDGVHWPLDIAHYDDLRDPKVYTPKILVVVVVPDEFLEWFEHAPEQAVLRHGAYWTSLRGMPESTNAAKKTVVLPRDQVFDVPALLGILKRVGDGDLP